MAGSHIDLRKRNAAFNSRVGKVNKLTPQETLQTKPAVPRWTVILFLVLIVGGFGLELLQQIISYFAPAARPTAR